MKIDKIKKLKNGKYKVELDNKEAITLYDEVIINNNLLFNKNIDNELLNKINKDNDYYKNYNKVLNYILYKMRSHLEVEEYMKKLVIPLEEQQKIITKLEENNFLNDNTYVKAFIADKINLTNDGPYKIKNELLKKNISEYLIDEELNKYDNSLFEEKIVKIIEKKLNMNNRYSSYILKQKLFNYLINLGYGKEMIISNLENIKVTNPDAIEKEYQTLYRKLSKKYDGENLFFEIKKRLYKKGFKTEEINSQLEKSE